jgi:hypothetical protein
VAGAALTTIDRLPTTPGAGAGTHGRPTLAPALEGRFFRAAKTQADRVTLADVRVECW